MIIHVLNPQTLCMCSTRLILKPMGSLVQCENENSFFFVLLMQNFIGLYELLIPC